MKGMYHYRVANRIKDYLITKCIFIWKARFMQGNTNWAQVN